MGGDTTRNMQSSFPEKINCVKLHLVGNISKEIYLRCTDPWKSKILGTMNRKIKSTVSLFLAKIGVWNSLPRDACPSNKQHFIWMFPWNKLMASHEDFWVHMDWIFFYKHLRSCWHLIYKFWLHVHASENSYRCPEALQSFINPVKKMQKNLFLE
jgi:hypothetical protein